MAACAALASLSHTLEKILQHPHPLNIVIPRKHMMFLSGKVDFLFNVLGTYSSRRRDQEIADMEMMILDVAREAENIIKSNVVSQTGCNRITRKKCSNHLYRATHKVVEKLLVLEEELLKMEAKKGKVAAYASLVSLTHILRQILHPPPLNKIIVDRQQIEFLQDKVNVLVHFLETYDPRRRSREILDLDMKIADAAYEAEDIIESNVVDQICATSDEDYETIFKSTVGDQIHATREEEEEEEWDQIHATSDDDDDDDDDEDDDEDDDDDDEKEKEEEEEGDQIHATSDDDGDEEEEEEDQIHATSDDDEEERRTRRRRRKKRGTRFMQLVMIRRRRRRKKKEDEEGEGGGDQIHATSDEEEDDDKEEEEDIIESNVKDQISATSDDGCEEDVNKSNVVDQIRATSGENISSLSCEGIERVLEKFLFIENELSEIKNREGGTEELHSKSHTTTISTRPLHGSEITMGIFEEHLFRIVGALSTDESNRQTIPITGMGGIGKTTLALAVYNNPFVVEHFYLRAWVTVSNEYTVKELLLLLLSQISKVGPDTKVKTVDELGLQLYRELFDRKYLIVLDDMWHIQVWEELKMSLPNNGNGSRILVTTRLSNLAMDFGSCPAYKLDLLDEEQSWDLLRSKIFARENCPVELEEIGKCIAKRCNGLPLVIVVIGGLLANSRTRKHWEDVAQDITWALMDGHDDQLDLLFLSYSLLPMYLKPCFLYLAVFPEDFEIRVSRLIQLWVAEGLIKSSPSKSFEEVARDYLEDLISRNLILVHEIGSGGKVKYCKIHDLIRDLCISEARKEKFIYIANLDNPNISPNTETARRLSISSPTKQAKMAAIKALRPAKFCRSWLCFRKLFEHYDPFGFDIASSEECEMNAIVNGSRLIKVVDDCENYIDISMLNNLRYVSVSKSFHHFWSIYQCWNLQTLASFEEKLPGKIWYMPQLRHVLAYGTALPDPPNDQNIIVLENLQTLGKIYNFKCTDQVLKRIPNLKKLRLRYYNDYEDRNYRLKELVCLKNLESLGIEGEKKLWKDIGFPVSLKKLSLRECKIPWEDFSAVGSLPNLEVLKCYDATKGGEWNPIEGSFPRLKFLSIVGSGLRIWGAENDHFPSLESLVLVSVKLKEIPASFAEILTLGVIKLGGVASSVWTSANQISYEREQLGYEPLQLEKI